MATTMAFAHNDGAAIGAPAQGTGCAHKQDKGRAFIGLDTPPEFALGHFLPAVFAHMARHDEPDDQAVQAERLGEDQNEDHPNIHLGLLCHGADARVTHEADAQPSGEPATAAAEAASQVYPV